MAEQAVTSDSSRQRAADVQRGTARAAVLGVSDGLVTNVSLILGISAAEAAPGFVRLAGFASLAAGAFSMAVGEYVSMRAQVELLERLLLEETEKLRRNPEAVRAELEEFIAQAGVSRKTAHEAVRQLCRDKRHVLGTYGDRSVSIPRSLARPGRRRCRRSSPSPGERWFRSCPGSSARGSPRRSLRSCSPPSLRWGSGPCSPG